MTDADLRAEVERHPSIAAAARALGMVPETLKSELKKRDIRAQVQSRITRGLPTTSPVLPPAFPDSQLVKDAGLDPVFFEVGSISASEAERPDGTTSYGRTVTFRKRKLAATRAERIRPKPVKPIVTKAATDTWVFLSDFHAPLHDTALFAVVLQVIRDLAEAGELAGICLLGDLMDLGGSGVSRHPQEKLDVASVAENIRAGLDILIDIREAAPDARVVALMGNHDVRLERYVLNNATPLIGLTDPHDREVFSLRYLLGLDELGIELVLDPDGQSWPHAHWEAVPGHLVAIHGTAARAGSGNSARATAEALGHGVIQGHVHRMGHSPTTKRRTDGSTYYVHAVEAGCMCQIKGGLGYSAPERTNWQQGAVLMRVHRGEPHFELCLWNGEWMLVRGKEYRVNKLVRARK